MYIRYIPHGLAAEEPVDQAHYSLISTFYPIKLIF